MIPVFKLTSEQLLFNVCGIFLTFVHLLLFDFSCCVNKISSLTFLRFSRDELTNDWENLPVMLVDFLASSE